MTINQIITKGRTKKRESSVRNLMSQFQVPFMKAVVIKSVNFKPKKPNSAIRKGVYVAILRKMGKKGGNKRRKSFAVYRKKVYAYVQGEQDEATKLNTHARVVIKAHKVQDLVGVRYVVVRNKGDCAAVPNRKTSRSKYGAKKPKESLKQ